MSTYEVDANTLYAEVIRELSEEQVALVEGDAPLVAPFNESHKMQRARELFRELQQERRR